MNSSTISSKAAAMLIGIMLWPAVSVRGEKLPPPVSGIVEVSVSATGEFSSKYSNVEEALAGLDASAKRLKVNGPLNGPDITAIKSLIGEQITELDLGQTQLMGEGKYSNYYDMEADVIGQKMFYDTKKLTAIVLPNGLKRIDKEAFYYCNELLTVDASSPLLTIIGKSAFTSCKNLTEITLNSTGLKAIENEAFYYCQQLRDFPFPSTLNEIGIGAFKECDNITTVLLPSGLKTIDEEVFAYCNELVTVDASHTTSIGKSAFYNCSKLTKITLGDGLTTIGANAFYNCNQLVNIQLPATLESIGNRAFDNCRELSIITLPENITTIPEYLFSGCSKLETVNFPSKLAHIEGYAFYGAGLTGNVQLPEGLKSIGYSAFNRVGSESTSIVIPASVDSIASSAFEYCYAQLSFAQPSCLRVLGRYAFNKTYNLKEAVLPNIEKIEESAFCDCYGLTHAVLPDKLKEIPSSMFSGCSKLQDFQLPSSLQNIGSSAFSNCEKLTNFNLPSQLKNIGEFAFSWCRQLTDITIPASVQMIGAYAFVNCSSITHVEVPEGITEIARGLFSGCTNMESVSIPSTITKIGNQAFYQCNSLTNITLPEGVKTIDDYAFSYCKNLAELVFPASVETIGNGVLSNCENLESVTLPTNLALVPKYFFNNCQSLRHVTLPTGASLTNAESLFYGCTQLESITMPATADKIPQQFCYDCTSLKSIVIPAGVKSIGELAFHNCKNMTQLTLPDGLEEIGKLAFNNCATLTSVSLPASLNTLSDGSFSNCAALQSIVIPQHVQIISKDCFYKCTSLASITLPEGLTTISNEAFRFCSALEKIDFPSTITSIGDYAFSYCDKLQSITIPDGFTAVPNHICEYCTSLASVTLPTTITKIGRYAFYHCENLPEIELTDDITEIGGYALAHTALTEIHIPTGLTKIDHIVDYCNGITTVYVPEGVVELEGGFSDCANLKSLYLPSTIEKITSYIIDGCPNIAEVHIKAPTVNVTGNLYYIGRNTATLYVPKGSLEFYSDLEKRWNLAYGWKAIVEEDYTFAGLDDAEWQILRQLPQQTNGEQWKRQWNLAATAAESEVPQGVTMRDGHITSISLPNNNLQGELPATLFELPYLQNLDLSRNKLSGQLAYIYNKVSILQTTLTELDLSGNLLTGNVYDICQKLPALTSLNVSSNRLRDAYPALPYTIKNLDLGCQDLSNEVTGMTYDKLFKMKGNPGKDVLPTILFYQHSSYNQENCKYDEDLDLDLTETITNPQWGIRIINRPRNIGTSVINSYGLGNTCWYMQPTGSIIYAWGGYYSNSGKSYFPLTLDYERGDVDFDLDVNLSDMQKILRFAVDSVSYGKGTPFNYIAANLYDDQTINVQDVVASINLLLDDDIVPHFARRKSHSQANDIEDRGYQAKLTIENGQLILENEVAVGAVDLALSDTDVEWQSALSIFSHKSRGQRSIFYSLFGDELPAGRHVLALTQGAIVNAMLVDRDGQHISLVIDEASITDIHHVADQLEPAEQFFDLQGRPVGNSLKPGIYVKNGKKQVIR